MNHFANFTFSAQQQLAAYRDGYKWLHQHPDRVTELIGTAADISAMRRSTTGIERRDVDDAFDTLELEYGY